MSFFASFTKKSKLDAAIKKADKARKSEGGVADQLFKEAYQDYADVLTGDSLRAAALYQWGVTLLRQAKTKSPQESINIYRNAIAKFSFCMTLDPNYLAAAIDAGVACMDLARARSVPANDELYEMAKRQFEKANSIQSGIAAFNLACVHGVRGDNDSCLEALKIAKDKGSLPADADIIADPDLAGMKNKAWFKEFVTSLETDRQLDKEKRLAAKAAEEEAKKPKPKNPNDFDPYHTEKKQVEAKKTKITTSEPQVTEEVPTVDVAEESPQTPPKKAAKKPSKTTAEDESAPVEKDD